MEEMFTLRPYQAEMIERARRAYANGHRRILMVAPTGAGKTHIMAAVAMSALQKVGGPVLYVAHRRQLVEQTVERFRSLSLNATYLMAGYETDWKADIFVASRDTLWRRRESITIRPRIVMYDEAHIGVDAQMRIAEFLRLDEEAVFFGYTATPTTLTGRKLGDFYTTLIQGPSYRELIMGGFLVPGRYVEAVPIDTSGLRISKTTGDYELGDVVNLVRGQVIGSLAEAVLTYADGLPTVIFLPTVGVSTDVATMLGNQGIPAATLDWSTPPADRHRILDGFRTGKIRILCNVDVLSEGWDAPWVRAVILASPTRSTARYIQRVGRGLRPYPGKNSLLVIDMAGQIRGHGLVEDYDEWVLEKTDKYSPRRRGTSQSLVPNLEKAVICPLCKTAFSKRPDCPQCGWRIKPRIEPQPLEEIPGEFREIWGAASKPANIKERWFREMLGLCIERGWKRGFAYHAFVFRWKEEPPQYWWKLSPLPPSTGIRKWAFWYIGFRQKAADVS